MRSKTLKKRCGDSEHIWEGGEFSGGGITKSVKTFLPVGSMERKGGERLKSRTLCKNSPPWMSKEPVGRKQKPWLPGELPYEGDGVNYKSEMSLRGGKKHGDGRPEGGGMFPDLIGGKTPGGMREGDRKY